MEALKQGTHTLFILLGAIMMLAMHAVVAFLDLGTVRKKNQVNALVKILVDFSVSSVVYFILGYAVAYGNSFFVGAEQGQSGQICSGISSGGGLVQGPLKVSQALTFLHRAVLNLYLWVLLDSSFKIPSYKGLHDD